MKEFVLSNEVNVQSKQIYVEDKEEGYITLMEMQF